MYLSDAVVEVPIENLPSAKLLARAGQVITDTFQQSLALRSTMDDRCPTTYKAAVLLNVLRAFSRQLRACTAMLTPGQPFLSRLEN